MCIRDSSRTALIPPRVKAVFLFSTYTIIHPCNHHPCLLYTSSSVPVIPLNGCWCSGTAIWFPARPRPRRDVYKRQVLGYGLMEWKPLTDTPQAVPASREAPGKGRVPEKISIPEKGEPVRLFTINAGNYFVPEDPRRSNFQVKYKPVEALSLIHISGHSCAQGTRGSGGPEAAA